MSDLKTPDEMAAIFVKMAEAQAGLRLDYSVESIAQVDTLIGAFGDNGDRSEAMGGTVTVAGAYVGEVLRQALGAEWVPAAETQSLETEIPLEMTLKGMRIMPSSKVAKRLDNGPEDDLVFYVQVLTERAGGVDAPTPKKAGLLRRIFGK